MKILRKTYSVISLIYTMVAILIVALSKYVLLLRILHSPFLPIIIDDVITRTFGPPPANHAWYPQEHTPSKIERDRLREEEWKKRQQYHRNSSRSAAGSGGSGGGGGGCARRTSCSGRTMSPQEVERMRRAQQMRNTCRAPP